MKGIKNILLGVLLLVSTTLVFSQGFTMGNRVLMGTTCIRPTGLTQVNAISSQKIDDTYHTFWNVSLAEARTVWDLWVAIGGNGTFTFDVEFLNLDVGSILYEDWNITSCTPRADGWYWFNKNLGAGTVDIITIVDGKITANETYTAV